ncbi:MAG TPA: polyribonucleotide nucleotidyltransferase, partial [Candidatus Ozemobacteraceae bacterium]|nr:polyribonucleotide nucleotidyltransferase [Candidatus Ozemobacteraceae bacterium]
FKREGRPTAKEILTSRLIDRPLRPMFPEGYYNEVQICAMVLSYDLIHPVDILAMNAASCALTISEIPFYNPVAAVRVGKIDGQLVVNPSPAQLDKSTIDMTVAGSEKAITMVESGSSQVSETELLEALAFAHENIKKLVAAQKELQSKLGKTKKTVEPPARDEELYGMLKEAVFPIIKDALQTAEKTERKTKFSAAKEKMQTLVKGKYTDDKECLLKLKAAGRIFEDMIYVEMRRMILEDSRRIDGRSLTDIRQITPAVGFLPRTHGSALFTRGQTQSLGIATLGAKSESQIIDGIDEEYKKPFILHYNFPPFSTGETKPMRGPGRREIGHGALAERALQAVVPPPEEFPYAIRVVSEILSSNGSSSMASVCSGSLALMDAGVPLKGAVAGIAMGLIKEGENYKVLSDILGDEDHLGDMDFKVAGTTKGVTALQMDIKIDGVTLDIMRTALEQARHGRLHILDKMNAVISTHRTELSPYAPRIVTIQIDPDKIRNVIGPGGKMIRQIQDETKTVIEIEGDGRVHVVSPDVISNNRAVEMIKRLTETAEVGKTYTGKVKRIMKFGAFVEILPGVEGMVHISQLAHERVNTVEDIVNIGDETTVKVIEIDSMGRINLSRKVLLPEPAGYVRPAEGEDQPRDDRPPRGDRPRFDRPRRDDRPRGDRHHGGGNRDRNFDRGPRPDRPHNPDREGGEGGNQGGQD